MQHNQQTDELLSGYMDGELDDAEVRQVRQMLDGDPAFADRLAALQRTRTAVKSLKPARLGPDFSQRVIERARSEARVAGLPPTHHVLRQDVLRQGNVRPQDNSAIVELAKPIVGQRNRLLRWRVSVAIVSVAALAAVVLLAFNLLRIGESETNIAPIATNEPARDNSNTIEEPAATSLVDQKSESLPSRLLMVVNVTLSKSAWDGNLLVKLLEDANIRVGGSIVASDKMQESLRDSMMIVKLAGNDPVPNGNDSAENVALMFVQADARLLDRAMSTLYTNTVLFPEVSFNVAFDPLDIELFKSLRDGTGTAQSAGLAQSRAVPVVINPKDSVAVKDMAQFSGRSEHAVYVSNSARSRGWASVLPTPQAGSEMMSEVLFIVRHK